MPIISPTCFVNIGRLVKYQARRILLVIPAPVPKATYSSGGKNALGTMALPVPTAVVSPR